MGSNSTVMGPEELSPPGDLTQAPPFNARTDKFQYRRDVRIWYENVLACADAGHNKAKGIAASLGRSLYARMDQRFKRIVDAAVDTGKLRFRNRYGSKLNEKEHIQTIEFILDLIAKDSVTDRIRRLVRMSKDVYKCKREHRESFPEYTARFQSAAHAYLSYANASSNGQDEQNFAMILIENAGLDLTTYNNIIHNLVLNAQNHKLEPTQAVEIKMLRTMYDQITIISNLAKNMTSEAQVSEEGVITTHQIESEKIDKLVKASDNAIVSLESLNIPDHGTKCRESLDFTITLDKAILALQDIKTMDDPLFTTKKKPLNTNDVSTPMTTQKIGTMLGGSRGYDEKSKNHYFAQQRKANRSRQYNRKPYRDSQYDHDGYRANRYNDNNNDARRSEEDGSNRKPKSIYNRLGKRHDHDDRKHHNDNEPSQKKKARYDEHDYDTDDDNSGAYPYFHRKVRFRSERT